MNFSFLYTLHSLFFNFEILTFLWEIENVLTFFLKQILEYSDQLLAEEWSFLCAFFKKNKFISEENSGFHKRELTKYHESFRILVLGEFFNKNNIIMISKAYHYVINLGITSSFYICIDPVYLESCARGIWVLPSP